MLVDMSGIWMVTVFHLKSKLKVFIGKNFLNGWKIFYLKNATCDRIFYFCEEANARVEIASQSRKFKTLVAKTYVRKKVEGIFDHDGVTT